MRAVIPGSLIEIDRLPARRAAYIRTTHHVADLELTTRVTSSKSTNADAESEATSKNYLVGDRDNRHKSKHCHLVSRVVVQKNTKQKTRVPP